MILFALVLVIAVSATFLIDSRWPNIISALSKLRPGLLVVLTSGLVVVGSLGVLVWWAWVGTPPCFTTGPVVSDPGFCPPLPTAAEIWTVFVVTLLVILIPCGLLVMAYLRQAPERPPPTAV